MGGVPQVSPRDKESENRPRHYFSASGRDPSMGARYPSRDKRKAVQAPNISRDEGRRETSSAEALGLAGSRSGSGIGEKREVIVGPRARNGDIKYPSEKGESVG